MHHEATETRVGDVIHDLLEFEVADGADLLVGTGGPFQSDDLEVAVAKAGGREVRIDLIRLRSALLEGMSR
jgi:hypothetical protein